MTISLSPSAKRTPATTWADRSRERVRRLDPELLAQARANSAAASGDAGFLYSLAVEIARARAPELARAYRGLVAAMAGFKNARPTAKRPAATAARPCVVLVVRRKQRLGVDHAQRLPEWMVTYADREGQRLPFALPTDVQDASEYHGLRAHAASELWTRPPNLDLSFGHYAALLQVEGDPATYLLSAMHVFSPELDVVAPTASTLDILTVDPSCQPQDQPRLAVGLALGGRLAPDQGNGAVVSLDLQLAILDEAASAQVMATCPLRGLDPAHAIATDPQDLANLAARSNTFELLRADNNPGGSPPGKVTLGLSASPNDGDLNYDFSNNGTLVERTVLQRDLLRFDAIDPGLVPREGDSGSAIVFRDASNDRLTLVAMHIAGNGAGASVAIPAWTLFDTSGWAMPPQGALTLVDPA